MQPKVKPSLIGFKKVDYGHANDKIEINKNLTIIDCSLGTNPFTEFNPINNFLSEIPRDKIYPYIKTDIIDELKEEIIKYFQLTVEINNIFMGHGGLILLERLATKFIDVGTILGIGPQFCYLINDYLSVGGKYESISILNSDFTPAKLLVKLKSYPYKAIYIDNPNNPTGKFVETAELIPIMEYCSQTGVLCIIDEAYGDFINKSKSALHCIKHYNNLIVIRSFSKGFGLSSLRSAYLILSDNLIPLYSKIDNGFEPSFVSTFLSQKALQNADYIGKSIEQIRIIKPRLISKLKKLGFKVELTHPDTSIIFIHKKNVDLFVAFNKINVLTSPGSGFKSTIDIDNSYTRLLVPSSIELVDEIIKRLEVV